MSHSCADVDARSESELTALILSIEQKNSYEVVNALIKGGADVNVCIMGMTPLLRAAMLLNPHPEVYNALIQAGADVNAQTGSGRTALMMSAANLNLAEIAAILYRIY
ncbi:MAG: ankyrin repeat domain-containing protein [Synergistaceae bacterium]|jgi:ankyrin repeat protein|nr:ankyrin repeat domain-containing protein [Synergistaceae bacterium]